MRPLIACLLLLIAFQAGAAQRVVSFAPSLTEIVIELDAADLLVGVIDGGPRPEPVLGLPSVGRYGQLDIERLLSLQPDLLLLWPGSVSAAQRDQLKRLNIPTYTAEPHTLNKLADQIEQIGERLGRADRGRQVAADFRQRLAALRERYRRDVPLTVFYQVWDPPLYTVGGGQIISDALTVCGARNVYDDLKLPAPQVSLESVLQRDPDVILASDAALLPAWKTWSQLKAVKAGRLIAVPDKGLERASGQMVAAVAKVCSMIAPER
ncbi:vitamin B12 transport system substrate-binding protein [Pseudomonas graminis]|uniref:cobalamin-binding protein n=1 Tax=Pseudomonas graminis TaxID=158627 RepID=UPI0010D82E7B|nr:cobalamin-binding protein [Pseudomonas graminis]TDV47272.1 vitamin B12 transport system substrate-binding protein [Pseudomonas graminis]